MPTRPENSELAEAVFAAAGCQEAIAELRGIYHRLDAIQADGSDHCFGGGTCCRFEAYGHRLYVTALELACLLAEPGVDPARADRMLCPYQQGPLCRARESRPLGCRTYFCRGDSQAQSEQHERLHQEIQQICARYGLAYLYVEITSAMVDLREKPPIDPKNCVDTSLGAI